MIEKQVKLDHVISKGWMSVTELVWAYDNSHHKNVSSVTL